MLCHFRCWEQSAIARLCALTDLYENTRWIRHHLRHGLDDTVPSEVSGCYLYDEILKIIAFQEPHRHTAFT